MKMKKSINNPEDLTPELLKGLAEAHRELATPGENRMVTNNKLAEADRVTIVTQGGSGHEPAISGLVGEGMVDISVMGDVFAVLGPQACLDAIKPADKGRGALYIVLNHAGDMLTDSPTMKKCAKEGLNVVKVATQENIANAPRSNVDDRRGLVGCIPTYKMAGAAVAEEKSLEEMAATAQRSADNTATLAVAVSGATHPVIGSLLADLGEDEMEIGMGQHGEGGDGRQTMKSADETAKIMPDGLLVDLDIREGKKIMSIFNGTGAITLMELLTIYHRCVSYLKEKSIEIVANYVGELLIIQEQAGFQMFMARMDDELLHYWNAPCNTSYMKKRGGVQEYTGGTRKSQFERKMRRIWVMAAEYMHIGILVLNKKEGMIYNEGMKLQVSNVDDYDFKIEYLKFGEGTPFPEILSKQPHVAYRVDDPDHYASQTQRIILEPADCGPGVSLTFVTQDDAIAEFYEEK